MEREKITAWVTKYALSSGIEMVDGEVFHDISSEMFAYGNQTAHGNDWHRTAQDALNRAEGMRKAKIVALKKQIEKLERMKIECPA